MPRGYPRYVLGVMVAINFVNYVDRWLGAAAAPLIQREFGLSDFQIGLLGTAFLLVYAVAAIPFGYWADRGVRKTVIGVAVTMWSLATVLSGLVASYAQLFLTRTVLGVGEAGYYPAGTSMLSDHFPKQARARAMSIWGAGSALGIAVGFAGGGMIASRLGWRSAFFMAAIPGLVCAALAFALREPARGSAEPGGARPGARPTSRGAYRALLRIPTLRWTILSQTCLYFVLASAAYWLPTLLGRRFGMSVAAAGLLAGVVLVAGGLSGTVLGGWLADRRARHTARAHLEVGIAGFVLGAIFISISLVTPMSIAGVPVFVPAFFLTVVCLYLHSGPFSAVAQNVVSPNLRAGAVTALLFVSHVFGDSHSTADVGFISDRLHSLQTALLLTSAPLLLAAAGLAALGLRSVAADTTACERSWAEQPPGPLPAGARP